MPQCPDSVVVWFKNIAGKAPGIYAFISANIPILVILSDFSWEKCGDPGWIRTSDPQIHHTTTFVALPIERFVRWTFPSSYQPKLV
jgi:hypothetical protein